MIPVTRSTNRSWLPALLVVTALLAAACSPAAGPLGTPASPAAPSAGTDAASPSDVVPDSPSPTASASPVPTTGASPTPASPSATPSPTATSVPTPSPTPVPTVIVRAYLLLDRQSGSPGITPVLRTVPETRALARAAMLQLLAGPKGPERDVSPGFSTAIPEGTRLLGVSIADGVATVNLSREFESGGGSFSVMARLAQVVYTLTQFSSVDSVRFELDGTPVTTFSGEGVVLDGPVGRADYRDLLPAIFVDRPAWGAAGGNPMRLSGIANVFEAQFVAQVLDGKGRVLAEQAVRASCGTGCWGTFKTDVAYDLGRAQYGTLRVFERSARDGSPANVTEYRIWLTPAG